MSPRGRQATATPRAALAWSISHGLPRAALHRTARGGDLLSRTVTDPELRSDPYAAYDEIRSRGALVRGKLVAATASHHVADRILRSDAFGVAAGHGELPPLLRRVLLATLDEHARGPVDPPSLLALDPPEHTRFRRLVAKVFTARAVAGLQPRVRELAEDLLDRLAASGGGPVDLVEDYAAQLPVAVITEILGVPATMTGQLLEWGNAAAITLDPGLSWRQYRTAGRALREMHAWMDAHIAQLRKRPGTDLLSQLTQLDGPDRLTDLELRATALLLLGAGFETTVNLISNAVVQLVAHPGQLAALRAEPAGWPNAVQEVLRYDSPVQVTVRQALTDTDVSGVRVAAGETALILLGGANRDPDVFADPHRFDIARSNAGEHLALSAGVHYCLGASLARLEAATALQALFDRFPDLALAGTPTRRETRVLRGYATLPVRTAQPAQTGVLGSG